MSSESSDRLLPLLASGILFAALALAAVAVHAQVQPATPGVPQTEAERIQSEVNRANQEREQRAQDQLRERSNEAERQDRRRQEELRQQERTPPSSRPTPLIPRKAE